MQCVLFVVVIAVVVIELRELSAAATAATEHGETERSCRKTALERCGAHAAHVAEVLRGGDSEKVRRFGHERLSVFGLLADVPEVNDIARVTSEQFRNVGSGDIGSAWGGGRDDWDQKE